MAAIVSREARSCLSGINKARSQSRGEFPCAWIGEDVFCPGVPGTCGVHTCIIFLGFILTPGRGHGPHFMVRTTEAWKGHTLRAGCESGAVHAPSTAFPKRRKRTFSVAGVFPERKAQDCGTFQIKYTRGLGRLGPEVEPVKRPSTP